MKKEEYLYAIESILFVSAKPLKIEKIATTVGLERETVKGLVFELADVLKDTGINVAFQGNKVSLVPNGRYHRFFERFAKKKRVTLSRSALEVVGLLLKKKRTRDEIEKVRGVNSARTINNLLKTGFIEKEFFEGHIYYKIADKFYSSIPEEAKEFLDSKLFKF